MEPPQWDFGSLDLPRPTSASLFNPSETQAWESFVDAFNGDGWLFNPQPISEFSSLPIIQRQPSPSFKGKERELLEQDVESTQSSTQSPLARQPDLPADFEEAHDKSSSSKSKVFLSSQQKKLNHVESERRRRQGIKEAFKELVDLIESEPIASLDPTSREAAPKGKKKRGRKGENGSTKSDVILKACRCIHLLDEDNSRLRSELIRRQGHL